LYWIAGNAADIDCINGSTAEKTIVGISRMVFFDSPSAEIISKTDKTEIKAIAMFNAVGKVLLNITIAATKKIIMAADDNLSLN
jgi:hypothetical protein